MKISHNMTRWVAGIIGSLGVLFPVSFAFADLTLTVNSLSPGTWVAVGQTLTFTGVGLGSDSPSYLAFDNFSGSTLSSSAMNQSTGAFSWTPTVQDQGVHTLSIEVTDGKGLVKIVNQIINVGSTTTQSSLALQSFSPGNSVSPGQTVTFTAVPSGFSANTYTLTDSFAGSSIKSGNINNLGSFSWIPASGDVGLHSITVVASDSSNHSANVSVSLQVNAPSSSAPATTASSSAIPMGAPSTAIQVTTSSVSVPVTTYLGSALTALQIQAVVAVLQAFGASQAMIAQVSAILSSGSVASAAAPVAAPAPAPTSVASASKYLFTSFLTVGSSGNEVSELQKRLVAEGFLSGAITPYFTTLTEAAVKQYQTAHHISPVGFVGPATRAVLNGQ